MPCHGLELKKRPPPHYTLLTSFQLIFRKILNNIFVRDLSRYTLIASVQLLFTRQIVHDLLRLRSK